jgi:hypothetical protein
VIIDPEFKSFIPPLTNAERESLEAAIVAAGRATDPLTAAALDDATECTLLDGHNRHEICEARGLPYTVVNLGHMTREQAKAWVFDRQIARRNLSTDQLVMLAVMRGLPIGRMGVATYKRAQEILAAGKQAPVIEGRSTIAFAWGGLQPRKPRPPRGPSMKPRIPEGHELSGQSTLTGPDGELRASWDKTRVAGADSEPLPEGFGGPSRVSRMSRADGTTVIEWASYDREKAAAEAATLAAWEAHAKRYTGLALPTAAPDVTSENSLAVYPIGDPHIGMLAWAPETGANHDTSIGTRELSECMRQLVARTAPASRALIIQLGDFFHAEDDQQRTPGHGHKLDVDGRSAKVREAGYTMLRGIVDLTLQRHRHVEIVNLPGNHDPNQAHAIAMWLRAVYENEPRVTVDRSCAAYFFREFGVNLIGACHGDGAKEAALPLLMASRQADAWGRTRHRVMHACHIHHTRIIEHSGCRTWYHNTLAGKDAWHVHRGYDSEQCLTSIVYDREYGQDSTVTVSIERIRAALSREVAA